MQRFDLNFTIAVFLLDTLLLISI